MSLSSLSTSSSQVTLSSPAPRDASVLLVKKRNPELQAVVPEAVDTIENATCYIPITIKSYSTAPTIVNIDCSASDSLVSPLTRHLSYNVMPNESINLLFWYQSSASGDSQVLFSFHFKELGFEEIASQTFLSTRVRSRKPFEVQVTPEYLVVDSSLTCVPKIDLHSIAKGVSILSVNDSLVEFEYRNTKMTQQLNIELVGKPLVIMAKTPSIVNLLKEFSVTYFILNNAPFGLTFALDALSDQFCNVGCRPVEVHVDERESQLVTLTYLAIKLGRQELPKASLTFQMADALDVDFIGGFIDVIP